MACWLPKHWAYDGFAPSSGYYIKSESWLLWFCINTVVFDSQIITHGIRNYSMVFTGSSISDATVCEHHKMIPDAIMVHGAASYIHEVITRLTKTLTGYEYWMCGHYRGVKGLYELGWQSIITCHEGCGWNYPMSYVTANILYVVHRWIIYHTMDILWEKFQWILPLYLKPISFQPNEYLNSAEQIPRNWNVDHVSVLLTSWDITKWCSINLLWKELMEHMSEHTGLISFYQLLNTAACTNTGGKMKGSHPRAADRCPFVLRL